jgi:tetratricopeptide (TPR) repeat protein
VGDASTQTEAYFLRGMSCFKQELYNKAEVDFDNVLRLNPHHEEAKKMKAQIASLMRKPRTPGELSSDTKTIEPGDNLSTSELINKGYALMTGDQPDVAIKFFAKAIKREPYNRDARRYIAYALLADHDAPAAIDQFANLERIGPLTADERSKYVEALRVAGKTNRAIAVLQHYLLSHPDDVSVRCDLAKLFASLDMLAEFQEICMQGMQVAKTAEEWDTYHSLMRETMQKAPDRSDHSDQVKEKPGG